MPITKKSSLYEGSTTGSPFTTAGSIDTTGASVILVFITDYNGNPASTISDNQSNSYGSPILAPSLSGSVRVQVWVKFSPTTNAAHTWTTGASAFAPSLAVLALTNTAVSAVDQTISASATASATVQPGSITPSASNGIIITGYGSANIHDSVSAPFSPVDGQIIVSGEHESLAMSFEIQTTATARNPTWTWAFGVDSTAWSVSILEPTAAGADLSVRLDEPVIGGSVFQ